MAPPVTRSITRAIRARVHRSVVEPLPPGPRYNAAPTTANCSTDSRDVRPNRFAPTRASRTPGRHLWYHRDDTLNLGDHIDLPAAGLEQSHRQHP